METPLTAHADRFASVAVVIPAWQPEDHLLALVADLAHRAPFLFIVVDDGSDASHGLVFDALRDNPRVRVLRHAVNLGKGRALKTAWNTVLTEYPQVTTVITADADGQHRPEDIVRVAERTLLAGNQVVLGCRVFSPDVPFRSRAGNHITRVLFAFLSGARVSDTQTGLRGFPCHLLPELMKLDGERYEYEMTVLAHLCRSGPPPIEVSIRTVYLDGNRSSHFNPAWDSMRIYFVLVRFYASSLLAAGVDLLGFSICFAFTHATLLSVVVGRASSLVNFALNRRFVFRNRGPVGSALWRYYVLVMLIGSISYLAIRGLTGHLHANIFVAKILVDVILSLLSFSAQQTFVFRKKQEER